MADKRITDLPLILSGDISSLDVLPIVNVELDITNKVTTDQLKAYINSGLTDVFVTGGTYNITTGVATFTNNTGGTFSVTGFYTGSTSDFFTGGTVSGATNFTNGLSADTFSATTYLNLPILGTLNYISKFTPDGTSLGNSQIIDDGTNIGVNSTPSSVVRFNVLTSTEIAIGATSFSPGAQGVVGNSIGAGVGGNVGVQGNAAFGAFNIGVEGSSTSDVSTLSIGGRFNSNGLGTNYSVQLLDGTEGVGKVLTSMTSDGKANWQTLPTNLFTGGTVSGATNFTNGLSADTFSATTISGGTLYGDGSNLTGIPDYYLTGLTFDNGTYFLKAFVNDGNTYQANLSILGGDLRVTGGTYDSGTGTATFTNNSGATFNVTGFLVGYTDTKVTGFTYDNINTFTIYDNSGATFNASITTLSATTISGGTFYGDGSNLTGVGGAGAEVTGFTYDDSNNLTILDSTGGTFSVNVDIMSALTVTNGLSGGTISITNTPSVSVTPTYILSRNSSTGEVEFTEYSAITRTIDPFNNIGNVSTITWDISGISANYEVTLTANTTLNITNVRNGDYGTIILKQDGVGSRTLTFGTINGTSGTNRHKVANGGGGNVFLTSNPNAVDLLTFAYNGTNLYWTIGNDYT